MTPLFKSIRIMPTHTSIGALAKDKLEQHFAAITDFDTAIRLKPDLADAYFNRGIAKDKLGQHNAAIKDYDTAIQIKPDLAQDYLNRGNVKAESGQYATAIKDFNTAIQIKSNYAEAYLNRGVAKDKLGQYNAAIKDFDNAIRLKPNIASRLKHSYAEVYLNREMQRLNQDNIMLPSLIMPSLSKSNPIMAKHTIIGGLSRTNWGNATPLSKTLTTLFDLDMVAPMYITSEPLPRLP